MKLIRFGAPGAEKPGIIHNGERIDVSTFGEDYDEQFFATDGISRLSSWLNDHLDALPRIDPKVRLGTPFKRPSKIICIGLNYSDHAKETGAAVPPEPVIFFKATSALVGPDDDLVIPRNSKKTDWEVELAVVIGKRASYVSESDAADYVAGYCLHNDYSEREFQLEHSGQWVKGKSCDTFAPIGPWLATVDEIGNVDNLRLWLKVNGELRQDGTAANLIYKVPCTMSGLSRVMSLLPGAVLSTGTPAGVGMGMTPPTFLKPGDVVELGIEGLGQQRQAVRQWAQ